MVETVSREGLQQAADADSGPPQRQVAKSEWAVDQSTAWLKPSRFLHRGMLLHHRPLHPLYRVYRPLR